MSLPKFLWKYRWARQRQGGKWERWDEDWQPVNDWSTPVTRPEMYGAGKTPAREDWDMKTLPTP
jgi:hypothetical protein